MRGTSVGRVFVVVGLLLLGTAATAHAQPSPVGVWEANVNGQALTLVLNRDGSGTLNGDAGRWSQRRGQLILTDANGDTAVARYDGRSITLTVEGVTLRFARRATRAKPAPAKPAPAKLAPGRRFNPQKKLKGKRVRPKGSGASFVVPRGWKHGYSADSTYQLVPNRYRGKAVVSMTRKMLSARERNMPITSGLRAFANEALGNTRARVVAGPEEIRVGGKRAGRMILQANVEGQPVEGYLGVVVDGAWAYVIVGLYAQSAAADLRAGADTVLSTFTAKAPKPNRRLMSRMAGCWNKYYRSTGGSGSGTTSSRYVFSADGTWNYSYYMSVSTGNGGGASDSSRDGGTWAAFGNTLYLQSGKGEDRELTISKRGAFTYFGDSRYLPCT